MRFATKVTERKREIRSTARGLRGVARPSIARARARACEMSRIRVGAVKSDVYTYARESRDAEDAVPAQTCTEESAPRLPRGSREFRRTGTTLSRPLYFCTSPASPDLSPSLLPTVLLPPPTRRVVSHALYLEARREKRAYPARSLSRRPGIAKICHARLYIREQPRDDVSFILLAAAMCGPP